MAPAMSRIAAIDFCAPSSLARARNDYFVRNTSAGFRCPGNDEVASCGAVAARWEKIQLCAVSKKQRQQQWTSVCQASAQTTTRNASRNSVLEQVSSNVLDALHSKADGLSRELQPTNIYLIGMMGCGKTTVGRILSEVLGYGFFDSDSLVEQTVGTTVAAIFAEHGEQAFRDLESQALTQLASMEGLVVASGGGAVLREANWRCMRDGIVVWIDVPLEILASRVVQAGLSSRPILSEGASQEDPFTQALQRLQGIHQKRAHLYTQADVRISLAEIAAEMDFHVGASSSFVSPASIALKVLDKIEGVLEQRRRAIECCGLPRCDTNTALECDIWPGEYGASCLLPPHSLQHLAAQQQQQPQLLAETSSLSAPQPSLVTVQ
eukprot:TRINITY_DN2689_c0_g1_i1.p1 TRINITY_DN2689_c0_g1~~TRINITY_DN2689_c0_g1_i1.p1  ORF type:complete len:380 (+),score=49.25 TRINITY_DN2689_c0_g1_i1:192-1331(+)